MIIKSDIGKLSNNIEDIEPIFNAAVLYAHEHYDPIEMTTYNHFILEYLVENGFIVKKE